jgi:hypothetical protein
VTARPGRRRLPKRSREQTRALMLRAATELVCEGINDTSDAAVAAALAHVQLTEVAARATKIVAAELAAGEPSAGEPSAGQAGDVAPATTAPITTAPITTGAIYQVWQTQAEFQADLVYYIGELDAAYEPAIAAVAEIVAAGLAAGQPAEQTLAQLVGWSYERTRESPTFYVSLGFFLRSGNARVREVLAHGDQAFTTAIRPVWQAMLDGYSLRMRAPYTVEDLAVSVSTLIDGFALQWKRQPERTADPLGEDGWSLAARLAVMIFNQLTEPADDQ